ncbi:MAG TPA: aldo/keto reductase [Candidatus Binatia bacterium]|nr:aldo/keto reductase [Candidatus Binatia bacterium]
MAILGGAAFAVASEEDAARGFRLAVERGVNHLDIAPRYGAAERLVGPHLPAVRDRMFVACKTGRKNRDGARAQLEESLRLLRTDRFDLYQLHAVTTLEVLDERREAAEVAFRARDEGLTRFVGITGHNVEAPATFVEALRRYDFDTVMFPVNPRLWADATYRWNAEELLRMCADRDVGVMAIKAAARRPWSDGERFATTWYEPYTDRDEIAAGVTFALSVPGVHAFCTPGDLRILPLALDAAEAFAPMPEPERERCSAQRSREPIIFPIPT